ncbi:MAG: 5-formyltetrahydrofolate cyclo-ligase [Candidatus Omnitrophota bacterium]|nr:MAG: 5-formyltetrahydrofolate cyclo-ligase [Candidatus Omnitrophota bacterium]
MMVERDRKSQLREKLLEKLLSLTQEEVKRRSENVEKILSDLPIYKDANVILAYYPLRGEVNVLGMIGKDLKIKKFCFPVMDLKRKDLRVFGVSSLDEDFLPGPYKIMQPDIKKTKELAVSDIDMVIVPGLAFDYHRNRLGRGAGFYDRFLKRLNPSAKTVGVAFDFQILKDLPVHPSYDEKVDVIVSEQSVI